MAGNRSIAFLVLLVGALLLAGVVLSTGVISADDATAPASASPRGDDAPVVLQGRVADVVDGDTLDLYDGTRVRLAIVDTPEVHGRIEPCGAEASDFTGAFLAGQTVAIYRPEGAPQRDRYGRLLGEVVRVSDGSSLNVALVQAGLGRVDDRFVREDPDLVSRLQIAAEGATSPGACRSVGRSGGAVGR